MAGQVIIGGTATGATPLPVATTIDGAADYLPIYTASATATQAINRNTLLNIASQPVGLTDSQTLTNKTLTSPTISGPTFSGTLIGTYTIGGTPTFPASIVTLTGSQTLTNKTLTSPTINGPSITNASITADTLAGYTSSTTGTVYGMSVSSGILASAAIAGQVNTAAIATNAVTAPKLSTTAIQLASVGSNSTVTGITTSYTLITGLTTTVTIPAGGRQCTVTAHVPQLTCNSICNISLVIYNAASVTGSPVQSAERYLASTTGTESLTTFYTYTPSPGSTSFCAALAFSAGSGNVVGGSGINAYLLVEMH